MLARWKRITGGGYSQFAQLHLADREEQGPDGALVKVRGAVVPTLEEEDVFTACKMAWVMPEERVDFRAVLRAAS